MAGRLKRKGLLLAKIQAVVGTEAVPSAATDSILISNAEYSVDPEVLERNFLKPSLSPNPVLVGSKKAELKFEAELRGNGKAQAALSDAPMLARLLRACGFGLTAMQAAAAYRKAVADQANAGAAVAFAFTGSPTLKGGAIYTLTCTTGGASGTAQVAVTCNSDQEALAGTPAAVTSGTPVALGTKGGSVTPTWTGNLAVGDKWRVLVCGNANVARPVSDNFEAATLYFYQDGVLHKMIDAVGTASLKAEAGKFGTMEFTFTGNYVPAEDAVTPVPVYETSVPPVIEFATLTYQSNNQLIVNDFSVELGNEVVARPSVNHANGLYGYRMSARKPTGSFNPEAELEAQAPFWADMAEAKQRTFFAQVGKNTGNIVGIFAPAAQATKVDYGDREDILTNEIGLAFGSYDSAGDDELVFIFA